MLTRTLAAGVLLATLVLAVPTAATAGPLTPGERQRLVAHLEMTERWLVLELDGLSDAQLTFKSAPDRWSIKDVVEHLAIAEPQYWTQLESSLKAPVKDGWKPQATDEQMLWYGIDRTNRQKTGEARVPHGQFASAKDSLASFRKLRATMLEKAKTSQEDFRGRPFMGGGQDVYQWFLMISTHSQRHILQIREIKAHPNYPKK
jgi:DinB family protein